MILFIIISLGLCFAVKDYQVYELRKENRILKDKLKKLKDKGKQC